jgi:hypothetical protein
LFVCYCLALLPPQVDAFCLLIAMRTWVRVVVD